MARRIYRMALGSLVAVITVLLTVGDSWKLSVVLRNRLAVALTLLVVGILCVAFKAPTLRFCSFLGGLTRLSEIKGKRAGAQQVADVGAWALGTGIAIVVISSVNFMAVYLGWVPQAPPFAFRP
jgi:hypothetical protein